jgi:hypothetical protein
MTTQADIQNVLGASYDALEAAMPELLSKCDSDAQRQQLISRLSSLRDVFWKAKATALQDFNATVEDLSSELKDAANEMTQQLQNLTDIVAVIGLVTQVIKLGGAIVTAAAA